MSKTKDRDDWHDVPFDRLTKLEWDAEDRHVDNLIKIAEEINRAEREAPPGRKPPLK